MKVPENHGKRKRGNNMKNKRQHRADEQFEIRQSKGNLMVTDETSDETEVNNYRCKENHRCFRSVILLSSLIALTF